MALLVLCSLILQYHLAMATEESDCILVTNGATSACSANAEYPLLKTGSTKSVKLSTSDINGRAKKTFKIKPAKPKSGDSASQSLSPIKNNSMQWESRLQIRN